MSTEASPPVIPFSNIDPPKADNSIVLPPPANAPVPAEVKPAAAPAKATETENSDPCCSTLGSVSFFVLALIFFLIFVTIAGVLGQSSTAFCEGYWRVNKKYQLSGHSKIAVWALLQGSSFIFLGLFWVLENRAAAYRMVALRDQLRTLTLLTGMFIIAWVIAGNAWVIGEDTAKGFGAIPTPCKDGLMGNRNLYHFCLAIIIFLDISMPIGLLVILYLTYDPKAKSFLNKTVLLSWLEKPPAPAAGANATPATTPAPATPAPATGAAASTAPAPPAEDTTIFSCCTFQGSVILLALGLILFLIFVTIAGALGQGETDFCMGYWNLNTKYQLSNHSTVAVWALLMGSAFFVLGFLWVLENRAAQMKLFALRDRIRTLVLLTGLFSLAWLIAGNVWIVGDEGAMGVVPKACKEGNMGNRNLYHFCLVAIIMMDITIPLILFATVALTFDWNAGTILNRTVCYFPKPPAPATAAATPAKPATAAPAPATAVPAASVNSSPVCGCCYLPAAPTVYPCCSLPVALFTFVFCVILFLIFVTIPSAMEPGTMAHAWDSTFCMGYWKLKPEYQIAGHSAVAVWALLMGGTFFFLGLFWLLENRAAAINARALRDQLRTLVLLTAFFAVAWMIAGNIWIIGDETTGSFLGVVPQACKDGNMGNRNLYHFCLAIIIFLDITVPLALVAVFAVTYLNTTLSFFKNPAPPAAAKPAAAAAPPAPAAAAPAPAKADPAAINKSPASAEAIYIGQA